MTMHNRLATSGDRVRLSSDGPVVPTEGDDQGSRTRSFPPPSSPASELERLHNVARAEPALANDVLKVYGTERALARIAGSEVGSKVVLKGGYLLRQALPVGVRRCTVDADLYCAPADMRDVCAAIEEALSSGHPDDHVSFDRRTIQSVSMQEDHGVRLTFKGSLGKGVIDGMLDIGTKAALVPGPRRFGVQGMLRHANPFDVQAYSMEMVIGEKFETILRRGITNTRLKDYYDLAAIAQHAGVDGQGVVDSLTATCELNGTRIPWAMPDGLHSAYGQDARNLAAWERLKVRAPMVTAQSLGMVCEGIWRFMEEPMVASARKERFPFIWANSSWKAVE